MTCRPSVRPLSRRLPRPMARICLRWFSKPPPSGTRDNDSLDRCRNIEAFDSEPKAWFYQEAETERNTFALEFARRRIWKTRGGRSASWNRLDGRKLNARSGKCRGKFRGPSARLIAGHRQ